VTEFLLFFIAQSPKTIKKSFDINKICFNIRFIKNVFIMFTQKNNLLSISDIYPKILKKLAKEEFYFQTGVYRKSLFFQESRSDEFKL